MHISDEALRRDLTVALAFRSTAALLAARAAMARLGQMLPRAGSSKAARELARFAQVPQQMAVRSMSEVELHQAAADEIEAAEDELLQLIAELGTVMTLPATPYEGEPEPAPRPASDPIAA
jgi:hypothetical protein